MSGRDERAAFAEKLRAIIEDFKGRERLLRAEYARDEGAPFPTGMLERTTRRFLIDEYLRALDWDPADPGNAVEEARSKGPSSSWLFLDYLGLDPASRAPVVVFEAKNHDVEPPRGRRGGILEAREMAELVAEAVNAIRNGRADVPVVAEWAEFLGDMQRYMDSLDPLGRTSLQRAVISAGRWIVVFRDPCRSFLSGNPAEAGQIHCFTSFDDILARNDHLFDLLHRPRLVDTLALTLDVPHALRMVPPGSVGQSFRAVLVATTGESGAMRRRHPTRSVYPAVVLGSGGRWFAVVDYEMHVQEPRLKDDVADFLREVEEAGTRLADRLARRFGTSLQARPHADFAGFPQVLGLSDPHREPVVPARGSTAARLAGQPRSRIMTVPSGVPGATNEFVVVTGAHRFYKLEAPWGPECAFHWWKGARDVGVAGPQAQEDYRTDSFTRDGQGRHCAHADLLAIRAGRCRVRVVETNLCCRACIFEADCWADTRERSRLPCPQEQR